MTDTLRKGGIPAPVRSTKDKQGRLMLLYDYDMVRQRVIHLGQGRV